MGKPILTIYLAGPFSGLDYEEAQGWRQEVRDLLKDETDIAIIDPMSHVEKWYGEGSLQKIADRKERGDYGIFQADMENGVLSADLVLAGFPRGFHTPSTGTGMELGAAYMAGVPVVVYSPEAVDHPMVKTLASEIRSSVEAAVGAALMVMERPPSTFEQAIGQVWNLQRKVLLNRRRKYGPGNLLKHGLHGVIVRMGDKISRIEQDHVDCKLLDCTLLLRAETRAFKDEPLGIEEGLVDLANYAGPASILLARGHWAVPRMEEVADVNE